MAMTLNGLLAQAEAWWSTPEAMSTASTIGGVGLIRWRHEPGMSPPMDVPFHTLRYRLDGYRSRRITKGSTQDFSGARGSVAIIAEGPQGSWEYLDNVDCVELYFARGDIQSLLDREGLRRVDVREQPDVSDPLLLAIAAEIAGLTVRGEREALYIETLVTAALLRIARAPGETATNDPEAHRDLAPWIRRRIEEYLQTRLANDVSLSELAAEADLPPFRFARAFQRSTGYSPFGYQRRLRMERALVLLKDSDLPIEEVARQIGYTKASTFIEIFTDEFGAPPMAWRHRARPHS